MYLKVAFLRGINIGGNNKIEMSRLKKSFESLGFTCVSTYLNSGNVVFSDSSKNIKKISEKIEKEILKEFKLEIRVLVCSAERMKNTLEAIPPSWEIDVGMKPHIAFLWSEIDSPDILKQIDMKTKVEMVMYTPGAIVWNVELKNWSKGSVYKFTNGKMGRYITVRSVNTVRKVGGIMGV